MWKRDFQCQWYKTTDGDVADQQSPKDGASVGGTAEENSGGVAGTTRASPTKGASETDVRGSSSPATVSVLETPTDAGTSPPSSPSLTALLLVLLVAGGRCLEP